MYVRFIREEFLAEARCHAGFFDAAYDAWYDRGDTDWRHVELRRELDWFNARLDTPDRFRQKIGRGRPRPGVCWFRDSATDHVSRARYVAYLLGELGRPIAELRSPGPGTVIWQDAHQIVAIPQRDRPIRRL